MKRQYTLIKMLSFLWTLCFFFNTTISNAQCTGVSVSDSLVLVNFYDETGGDNWVDNSGWKTLAVAEWFGITLCEDGCFVKEIDLGNNNLMNTIPNINLPQLEILILINNDLIGTIPNFSSIPNIKNLRLTNNELTGDIPNFNNLPNVTRLQLSHNSLTGVIPNFSNLPSIQLLNFSNNQLDGTIPNFTDIPTLEWFYFQNNNLTGTIPNFNQLPELEDCYLANNNLTGTIPNFSDLPKLRNIRFENNNLTGSIPDFHQVELLETLYLQGNLLTGSIPNFHATLLYDLKVCANDLFGNIPLFEYCPLLNVENIDFSCLRGAKLMGSIFYDENEDCLLNDNEIQIPQGIVVLNNGENYAFSDQNGNFILNVDTGTHTISYVPPNSLWGQNCSDGLQSYEVHITSLEDTIQNLNFASVILSTCPLMKIDVNTPFQRRCFTNTYTVQYGNEGTATAENAYIEMAFEEEIIVLDASIPYTQTDSLYVFEIGNVDIGESHFFTITDSIACDAVLGSAACVSAHIFPDDFCQEIDEEWDGSDIQVQGFCLGDIVQFTITNNGEAMADSSEYRMYEDDVLLAIAKFELVENEMKTINVPATGKTYRLVAEQSNGHPSSDNPQAVVELCGQPPFSLGFVTSQAMSDIDPFIAINCEEIIGSYNSNNKTVMPEGIGEEHLIENDVALEYKIHFQNVGNDTAFQVIIVDTLDTQHLNINTLEILNSSHSYTLEMLEASILRFTFNDIMLLDSNTNELASHGFVSYKIEQIADNELGTVIENEAYIFFDYNQPIQTETTSNKLWEVPLVFDTISFVTVLDKKQEIKVYPNPAKDIFYIDFSETKQIVETAEIKIYDVFGRLVLAQKINVVETHFNVSISNVSISDLQNGIYVYKIVGENAVFGSGKIVVE